MTVSDTVVTQQQRSVEHESTTKTMMANAIYVDSIRVRTERERVVTLHANKDKNFVFAYTEKLELYRKSLDKYVYV